MDRVLKLRLLQLTEGNKLLGLSNIVILVNIHDTYKDTLACELYRSVFCFVVIASSNATLRLISMNLNTRIW